VPGSNPVAEDDAPLARARVQSGVARVFGSLGVGRLAADCRPPRTLSHNSSLQQLVLAANSQARVDFPPAFGREGLDDGKRLTDPGKIDISTAVAKDAAQMSARETILERLNDAMSVSVADVGVRAYPQGRAEGQPRLSTPSLLEEFLEQCHRSRTSTSTIESKTGVPSAVAEYLVQEGLSDEVIVSDPLQELDWSGLTQIQATKDRFSGDGLSVVSEAQFGVSETGSIVVLSGPDSDVRLNFLAETHIAILRESAVLATAEAVWAALRPPSNEDFMPRAVNFITGPSRTADIEQTIEFGAHGPRRSHIILYRE